MHWSRHLVPAILSVFLLAGWTVEARATSPSPAAAAHDEAHPLVMQATAAEVANARPANLAPFSRAAPLAPRRASASAGRSAVAGAAAAPDVAGGTVGGPLREVFGFALASSLADPTIGYPGWNFDLLSTVAVFGLAVAPTGDLIHDGGWTVWNSSKLTDLINVAHPKGVKVVETIILQDFSPGTPSMCAGLQNRQTTVTQAVAEMHAKGVDGINVDYEGLNGTCPNGQTARAMMTSLVAQLRAAMGPSYLSVDTYASSAGDPVGFFDLPGMAPSADSFFVMEYDMEYSNYAHSPPGCSSFCLGPTSPLGGYYYNDAKVTAQYMSAVGPSKVIMGIPYYGRKSCVAAAQANQVPQSAVSADSYQDAFYDAYQQPGAVTHHVDANDPAGAENWETWSSTSCPSTAPYRELYWDSTSSLANKYDLVNRDGIRGVGIWNLNFGGSAPELWDTLSEHFTSNTYKASTTQLYQVPNSDGNHWVELDPGNLRLTITPTNPVTAVLAASATLWTDTAGYNQDLGIFISANGGPDVLLSWKESGSVAAAYSPNASYVELPYPLGGGTAYTVKLKLKANRSASGVTIFSGAGTASGGFSQTTLMAHLLPAGANPYTATTVNLYGLGGSDGSSWSEIDPNLRVGLAPTGNVTALIGDNVDLWTDTAGYNQDIGIFLSENGGPDQLLAWKESGGIAAAYSPTPAFVQATAALSGGSKYVLKLKWKANRPAPGVTIFAAAGTAAAGFSPSRVVVELIPKVTSPFLATSSRLYQLGSSNGASWNEVDPANLRLVISPVTPQTAILGANADVWTGTAGLNQDIGIFVSINGGADQMLAWTESGDGGASFSPNASFVQSILSMSAGNSYTVKLKWKANRPVDGSVIYAGAGTSSSGFSPTSLVALLQPGATSVSSVSRNSLFILGGSDGTTWKDLDAGSLLLSITSQADGVALLTAGADLWTDTAGYNQDLGIFVSSNGGADQLLAWKESGGVAAQSPNAVFVQASQPITHGVNYTAKLKWKTNRAAPSVTIYAGAGTAATGFSPTRLASQLFPPLTAATSSQPYTLSGNDGSSWVDLDPAALAVTVTPSVASTALLGASADLWTESTGYGQDLGIFLSAAGGPDQLLAWQESGGNAGTFAPNAAFVQAAYAVGAGTTYRFKLKWKASKPASGAAIHAAAGTLAAGFSPTSLVAQLFPTSGNPATAAHSSTYSSASSDGAAWTEVDATNLRVTVTPASNQTAVLGAGASLFTDTAGYNQDIGVFVSVNGGADQLLGWKESGGVAAANSSNAAFVQAVVSLQSGASYTFKVKWKANQAAAGVTIHAGVAGTPSSGTGLFVSLID